MVKCPVTAQMLSLLECRLKGTHTTHWLLIYQAASLSLFITSQCLNGNATTFCEPIEFLCRPVLFTSVNVTAGTKGLLSQGTVKQFGCDCAFALYIGLLHDCHQSNGCPDYHFQACKSCTELTLHPSD